MDQKKKIQVYMTQIYKIHQEQPELSAQRTSDFENYEKFS